jgi:hypothetical protein
MGEIPTIETAFSQAQGSPQGSPNYINFYFDRSMNMVLWTISQIRSGYYYSVN